MLVWPSLTLSFNLTLIFVSNGKYKSTLDPNLINPYSSDDVALSPFLQYVTILLAKAPAICLNRMDILSFVTTTVLLSFNIDDFGCKAKILSG